MEQKFGYEKKDVTKISWTFEIEKIIINFYFRIKMR